MKVSWRKTLKQPEYVPGGAFFRFLIPPEPRRYRGQRWAKMVARSAHVLLSGIYLGAFVFQVDPGTRGPWFLATLLSGFLMIFLDLFESGAFLLQLRGLVVAAKLALLALGPVLQGLGQRLAGQVFDLGPVPILAGDGQDGIVLGDGGSIVLAGQVQAREQWVQEWVDGAAAWLRYHR